MSEQYEPSYYEIALTGRQVLAAFVVLLVCLVAAFFSGVWVGRGEEGGPGERTEEARAEAPADEEARLEELSFFDAQPGDSRQRSDGAGAPEPDLTSREDVGGRPAPAVPPAPEPAKPEPAEEPESERRPPAGTGGATGSEGRPERPRRESNPSGSLATGDIVIQVFSSGEEAKARDVLARLERNGFRAFLSPMADAGRTLYRVRVGPFEHRSEAEEVAERLRSAMNLETWITQ